MVNLRILTGAIKSDASFSPPLFKRGVRGICRGYRPLCRVAMKVRYPSRVRCAYHCTHLKVRTAYHCTHLKVRTAYPSTWYGFHRRGCKQICMDVRRTHK